MRCGDHGVKRVEMTKTEAAAAARARGENRFLWACKHHGPTQHYSANRQCVACKAREGRDAYIRIVKQRRSVPEARDKQREYLRKLRVTSAKVRGTTREGVAATTWHRATGGNMVGWYGIERDLLRQKYAALPKGFEGDHATPKIAKDAEGEQVASGLHCWANVAAMPKYVNRIKHCNFAPETNRAQRPANRFPGGAFDPTPTDHERALIALAEGHGTPAAVSLATLRDSLDAKAREYEQHAAALIARITTA